MIWKPGDNIGQVFYGTGFIIGRSGLRAHNIFRSWQGQRLSWFSIISWLFFCDNVPVTCIHPIIFPFLCDSVFCFRKTGEFFFLLKGNHNYGKDGVLLFYCFFLRFHTPLCFGFDFSLCFWGCLVFVALYMLCASMICVCLCLYKIIVCFMVMYEYEDGLDFLGLVELFTTATNLEFLKGKWEFILCYDSLMLNIKKLVLKKGK